jgi:hypothetical protein
MFVIYTHCRATPEGDPAEWLIATDREVCTVEYETQELSECVWIVPTTEIDQ